ncbi:MAG: hypothetical protein JXA20_18135 [Spirochaetes bacterium]|nr:hypothetical protein [Spirochaetota bacterium]
MRFLYSSLAALILFSCASGGIRNEVGPTAPLGKYKNIHAGWINFNPAEWKTHGFTNQGLWVSQIREINVLGLQKYLQDRLPDRTITGASGPADSGRKGDLHIGFNIIKHTITFGETFSGMDELLLEADMIDTASNKSVYKATVQVEGFAPFPRNWKGQKFEGRLDNMMYNLANILARKLRS